jgi:DNA ligase-1
MKPKPVKSLELNPKSGQVEELRLLLELTGKLRDTSKRTEKEELIRRYVLPNPVLCDYVCAAYDPYRQYHLKSSNVAKNKAKPGLLDRPLRVATALFSTLIRLQRRHVTGHAAISEWLGFLKSVPEDVRDLCNSILDKDLKCHTGEKTWNKIFKELKLPLIPTFSIALGRPSKNLLKERMWEHPDGAYVSRKYDGVRVLLFLFSDGSVVVRSRTGKTFRTLGKLTAKAGERTMTPFLDCVLDGEVSLTTKWGEDDFQGLMKQITRKNHTIESPRFHIFDCIPLSEFNTRVGTTSWEERQKNITKFIKNCDPDKKFFTRVKQIKIETKEELMLLRKKARVRRWEGLIVRIGSPYKGTRSKDIWKIKDFLESEFTITGVEIGTWEAIVKGKTVTLKDVVVSVKVDNMKKGSKRVTSNVGSGLTIQQRIDYAKDPDHHLMDKVVTVKYFEPTTDDDGDNSIRFPTLKWKWKGSRDL